MDCHNDPREYADASRDEDDTDDVMAAFDDIIDEAELDTPTVEEQSSQCKNIECLHCAAPPQMICMWAVQSKIESHVPAHKKELVMHAEPGFRSPYDCTCY